MFDLLSVDRHGEKVVAVATPHAQDEAASRKPLGPIARPRRIEDDVSRVGWQARTSTLVTPPHRRRRAGVTSVGLGSVIVCAEAAKEGRNDKLSHRGLTSAAS